MTTVGQLSLLVALVGSGYAAFACLLGWRSDHRGVRATGLWAALAAVGALTATTGLLAWALLSRDFRFQYVTQYCDQLLPWHYCLSALWVGQAGSLLIWAWFLAVLAAAFRFWPGRQAGELREPAFGLLMAYLCFLVAVMVFAADPMRPSLTASGRGNGLDPSLQHPAMMVHPPIVFLGYAAWAVPCALAIAALLPGRQSTDGARQPMDAAWTTAARPWAVFAWVVLGGGILWGAEWAYEELGWGGYWSWDPVENGSLVPWLTGTALIHCLMAWKYAGALKKTALALAVATFGLCNLATFLTRSGIFSSLHAFSQSPIGWMFLVGMVVLALGGGTLLVLRRAALRPQRPMSSIWSREALVLLATAALLLLAAVATVGTLLEPLSFFLLGRSITLGPAFYNKVLVPTGLVLLLVTAAAPLVRWGNGPTAIQKRAIWLSLGAAVAAVAGAFVLGARHPIALAVAGLAALAAVTPLGAWFLALRQAGQGGGWLRPFRVLLAARRQYAGYLIHLGFACLAVGVTGSSLGTQRHELVMTPGESVAWAGRSVRYADLVERELPDKLVVEARLEISQGDRVPYILLPAQHLHRGQNAWSGVVAIHSTWSGDFYTILHGGNGRDSITLTLLDNPLIRWMWLAGWISAGGAVLGLWPVRRRSPAAADVPLDRGTALAGPHRSLAHRRREAVHG